MPASALERMAAWAAELTLSDVPTATCEQAKSQVLSTLAAAHAGFHSDLGPRIARAFPPPTRGKARAVPSGAPAPPAHAAFLGSAWSMVLDFDDTMLGGHTGHSSVFVPLAYGEANGCSGAEVLLSQIVANELAARVNTAVALGPLRGQMATHIHLIAAAAGRAKLEGLDATALAEAVGFALAYPAKALYPAFLGSDAKVLCAAWPLRMGAEAVDAIRAGLRGNPGVLDDRRGFLRTFADVPVPELLGGLGERWHTDTLSFKVYPGCAYVDAVIDATLQIVRRFDVAADEVDRVDVHASIFTVGMDAHSAPYVRGPGSLVSTLSFSTAYNVACAIRDRDLTPSHLTRARIDDPATWALARKVHLHHDEDLTTEALLCDIPIGAALKRAGTKALRYAVRSGGSGRGGKRRARDLAAGARMGRAIAAAVSNPGPLDFSRSEKAIGARVQVRTTDGRLFEESVRVPIGAAGSGDWKVMRGLMREKFLACAAATSGEDAASEAADLAESTEQLSSADLARLVELNCARRTPQRHTPRAKG